MILKAQEVHFELHNSTQHRYEVDMTNDGHTSSTGAQGTLLWVCHLGACCSSYQHRICVVELKVRLLSFHNHLYLLHLIRMSTWTKLFTGGVLLR